MSFRTFLIVHLPPIAAPITDRVTGPATNSAKENPLVNLAPFEQFIVDANNAFGGAINDALAFIARFFI